jgi:hypothetical protein
LITAINWQDAITNAVATVGGGGVCLLSAAWLIRSVITDRLKANSDAEIERVKNALVKEAEAFKMQIKADADAANERLKNSLQMMALEHQVRFSKLHEKRAEIIEELDRRLYELQVEGQHYVERAGRAGQEAYVQWRNKFIECNSFLDAKQIFLTEEIYSSVFQYLDAVKRPLIEVESITCLADGSGPSDDLLRRHSATIFTAIENSHTKIPAMRYALIKEFRTLLGGAEYYNITSCMFGYC